LQGQFTSGGNLFLPYSSRSESLTLRAPLLHKTSIFKLHQSVGVDTLESVKRWYYIVLIGIGLGGAGYVYLHRQELGLVAQPGSAADEALNTGQSGSATRPAPINWQKLNRPKDGFHVEMPNDPKEIQIPAYNEHGGTDQVSMIFSNPDADTTYAVVWSENPPVARINGQAPERTLDMARDGALARTQTTLVNEAPSSPQDFPARDFVARNVGGGILNSRLIYAGSRLYMLIAAFPSASARRDRDVEHFFASFSVTSTSKIPTTMPLAPPASK
jgi:hypothetical protein